MSTRRTRSAVHRRILTATTTATALTAAAVLTGCSKNTKAADPTPTPPGPSASPSPSADPQASEKAKALAAYDGFWVETVKAYESGTDKGTKLVNYAANSALDDALTDITNMQKAGITKQGSPGHRPEATALNLSSQRPTATITDCLDLSTWRTIDRATGKVQPYPSEQPLRYIAVAEVELWAGQWLVVKMTPNGDRTC
ncbi:hypothetical protein ACFWWA_32965 [Streptomyces goshikiensis]|uniref:hypothetical protein n=1 Tax=Streptomyces goshikiensis TaxID=1942 RepID=UPI003656DE60